LSSLLEIVLNKPELMDRIPNDDLLFSLMRRLEPPGRRGLTAIRDKEKLSGSSRFLVNDPR
jgi:hypothetical protein